MPNEAVKRSAVATSASALFARNFFKYPSMLGSVVPSSRFLVKDLMGQIDWERARVLVEFGPGVGTITREVLKRGVGVRLPLHPGGPAWWSRGWERWREWLRGRRWALHTCHVIGTVGRRR